MSSLEESGGCTLFYACSDAGRLCIPFLVVACVGFVSANLTFLWLWRSQGKRVGLGGFLRGPSALCRVLMDPVANVAIADAATCATLAWGGAMSLRRTGEDVVYLRDVAYDLTVTTTIAACFFGGLTAYSFFRIVRGDLRGVDFWKADFPCCCVSKTMLTSRRQVSLGTDSMSVDEDALTLSMGRENSDVVAYLARASTAGPKNYGANPGRQILGVWLLVLGSFLSAMVTVVGNDDSPKHRLNYRIAFSAAATMTFLMAFFIFAFYRGIISSAAQYPESQRKRLRREVKTLTRVYALRCLFVTGALLVFVFDPKLGCNKGSSKNHHRFRVIVEFIWASSTILDALAFFLNVFALDAARSGSLFSREAFPLKVIEVDDRALMEARLVGHGTFGTVRILDARFVENHSQDKTVVAVKSFMQEEEEMIQERSTSKSSTASSAFSFGDGSFNVAMIKKKVSYDKKLPLDELRAEAYRASTLKHKRLVTLFGIAESPSLGPCLVSEFMDGGSLFEIINVSSKKNNHHLLNSPTALRCARHVAAALAYLHSQAVIHRDLKSANVLIDTAGHAAKSRKWRFKVCDYATSRVLLDFAAKHKKKKTNSIFFRDPPRLDNKKTSLTTLAVGTPYYLAPEIINQKPYDDKVDVYSYAIILWELASKSTAWYEGDPGPQWVCLFDNVSRGLRPTIKPDFDDALADIMPHAWAHNPRDRPSFADICETLDDEVLAAGDNNKNNNQDADSVLSFF